jgi:hypothetical protein
MALSVALAEVSLAVLTISLAGERQPERTLIPL